MPRGFRPEPKLSQREAREAEKWADFWVLAGVNLVLGAICAVAVLLLLWLGASGWMIFALGAILGPALIIYAAR
jgi:membrane protein YdbS with pleckstrin-like domain